MVPDKFIQVNTAEVVFEIFDDEIVLINIKSGNYYSMDSVAVEIWKLIDQGVTENRLFVETMRKYHGDREDIERSVQRFLNELQHEELITLKKVSTTHSEKPSKIGTDNVHVSPKSLFEKPTLNRYTDMKDLLLLDPIHEGDGVGWPGTKADSSDQGELV